MTRILVIAFSAAALTACGPRLIKLPTQAIAPTVAHFEQGVNARTKLLDYEIPEVKQAVQKTQGFSVKTPWGSSIGNAKQQQERSFTVIRGSNAPIEVNCELLQQGARVANRDFSKHTYKCGGNGFELLVDEAQRQVFAGTARVGDVALELESTDQMKSGAPMGPSGFHLRRNGRWVGSFEYFQFGNAYLGTDLSADERDAVLVAMVSIQSTNHWLARDVSQNQSSRFGR